MPKFKKGHPRYGGRQKGVLTRGQTDIQRLARELVTDTIYLENQRARLRSGKCSPQVEAKLYAYAFGEALRCVTYSRCLNSQIMSPAVGMPAAADGLVARTDAQSHPVRLSAFPRRHRSRVAPKYSRNAEP